MSVSSSPQPAGQPLWVGSIDSSALADFERFVQEVHTEDGTPAFSEQTLVEVRKAASASVQKSQQQPVSFWLSEQGQLHALAVILPPTDQAAGTIEATVAPSYRGRGLGRKLADALATYLADNPGEFNLWAHQIRGEAGAEPTARAEHLASALGFRPVRDLRKMALALTDSSREKIKDAAVAASLPQGLELTTFVPGEDDAAWLELNAAAFANHPEQGSLTQADLDERVNSDWFRSEGFFIARDGENFAGYHWTKIPAGQHEEGEVYAVGISPAWQGKGLGRALTLAGMNYLAQASAEGESLEKIALYVDAENVAAVKLYESLGFEPETIDIMYTAQFPADSSSDH